MSTPQTAPPVEEKKDEVVGLDADEGEIRLVSKGQAQEFTLPKSHAYLSQYVKVICQGDKQADHVEVTSVAGPTLERVVNYLRHHAGKPADEIKKPLRSLDMKKVVTDPWDAEFINQLPQQELFDVIVAANFMDIQGLLHLGCAKVASCIKGKANDEIKKLFQEGKVGFVAPSASAPVAAGAAGAASEEKKA